MHFKSIKVVKMKGKSPKQFQKKRKHNREWTATFLCFGAAGESGSGPVHGIKR